MAAPAIEGRANEALIDYLARALGVPRRALRITAGASGRRKTVALQVELQASEVLRRLSG